MDAGFVPVSAKSFRLAFGDDLFEYYLPLRKLMIVRFKGRVGFGFRCSVREPPSGTYKYCIIDEGTISTAAVGYIQIPSMISMNDGSLVDPDKIVLQTVVSKWMGSIEEWDAHLLASKEAGYNMIHFTPLQRRGLSNSPYSIYDHLELSKDLFKEDDPALDRQKCFDHLKKKIDWMHQNGLLSMTDVVWNHCACDSPWLKDHPEATYNLENSRHLRVAYDLDECIMRFSAELASYELSCEVRKEEDVQTILSVFAQQVIPKEALWEYFVVNVSQSLTDLEMVFRRKASMSPTHELRPEERPRADDLEKALFFDGKYERHSYKMDLVRVVEYYRPLIEEYRACPSESERSLLLSQALSDYRQKLDKINYHKYSIYDQKIQTILLNLKNRMIYERLADHGPKLGPFSAQSPLVPTYFTRVDKWAFANNGWIWNADPLVNFVEEPGDAYFTRDIIVWGDCVKLRYGNGPGDNPWLWEYMTEYTRQMATIFHGFRIDNCHSTPIHVAKYLLDEARKVRPDLYVCAELFTGSEEKDMLFVTHLGLNSLIREAMAAWDVAELARITTKYGGHPEGFSGIRSWSNDPHALYMDCTHDNETPTQKRTTEDALPNAAIVAVCASAIGSTRGYDELTPNHLNIVTETRKYPSPDESLGLWRVRKHLNQMHQYGVEQGMTAISAKQDGDVLIVERWNPDSLEGIVLLSRTAFTRCDFSQVCKLPCSSLILSSSD